MGANLSAVILAGKRTTAGIDGNTKLLLHMDGTNGGSNFPDDSAVGATMTATVVTTSTTSPKFGTASAAFNGSTTGLAADNHALYEPGAGDFTIDFWVKYASLAANQMLACKHNGSGAPTMGAYAFYTTSSGVLDFYSSSNGTSWNILSGAHIKSAFTVDSLWHHVAISRSGSNLFIFYDGALISTNAIGAVTLIANATCNLTLGRAADGNGSNFNGNIDEFRYSNVARWTAAFTPATAPYS